MLATQFARLQFRAEKNHWTKFIAMQNQYNLLYCEEERETNAFLQRDGRRRLGAERARKGRGFKSDGFGVRVTWAGRDGFGELWRGFCVGLRAIIGFVRCSAWRRRLRLWAKC
jgi:hypothetical protein